MSFKVGSKDKQIDDLKAKVKQLNMSLGGSQAANNRLKGENRTLQERVDRLEEANGMLCAEVNEKAFEIEKLRCDRVDLELSLQNMLFEYKQAASMADSALNGGAFMAEAEEWDDVLREMDLEVYPWPEYELRSLSGGEKEVPDGTGNSDARADVTGERGDSEGE